MKRTLVSLLRGDVTICVAININTSEEYMRLPPLHKCRLNSVRVRDGRGSVSNASYILFRSKWVRWGPNVLLQLSIVCVNMSHGKMGFRRPASSDLIEEI